MLTVKGRDWLERADVVIYDHLVSPRVLELCRQDARRIYVGKEQGAHTTGQREINRLLIAEASAGRQVVRLKGGDPTVFGRGGEEAWALADAGVPFDIVPGVTSAVAAPAYAGIPVTHRALSSSVAIVTGRDDIAKPEHAGRWDRLATAADTLICLMGVGTLRATAQRLMRCGRAPSTPCAVVEWGTLPTQRTVTGTLATIADACRRAKIRPPATVIVGEVVRLRGRLNWFERKPLFGRRIVVTRAADRAGELIDQLVLLGADVIAAPAIAQAPAHASPTVRRALEEMSTYQWVFFTSPEGVGWFERLLRQQRRDLRVLRGCHLAAIGPKTAESLRQYGLHVDFTPTQYSQEGLLDGLTRRRRLAGARALIVGAEQARDALERGLRAAGADVQRMAVYRTVMPPSLTRRVRAVFREPVDLVTVTSSSCMEHLAQALQAAGLARLVRRLRFASIGPATSATVRRHRGRLAVEASTSTIEGLVEAIVATIRRRRAAPRRTGQRGG